MRKHSKVISGRQDDIIWRGQPGISNRRDFGGRTSPSARLTRAPGATLTRAWPRGQGITACDLFVPPLRLASDTSCRLAGSGADGCVGTRPSRPRSSTRIWAGPLEIAALSS
ncbi:unnamed protein product [Arctogadus glacialis]